VKIVSKENLQALQSLELKRILVNEVIGFPKNDRFRQLPERDAKFLLERFWTIRERVAFNVAPTVSCDELLLNVVQLASDVSSRHPEVRYD
jgi:hypothetical protein